MNPVKTYEDLLQEVEELSIRLQEADGTIHAIRTAKVDAIVVKNEKGHQLYTLKSADQTYRVLIEKMKEGAITLNKKGIILYSNSQFASMVNLPLTKVIGLPFSNFIPEEYRKVFNGLFKKGWESDSRGEIFIHNTTGKQIPFLLSFTSLELDEETALSIILTDLTVQKEVEKELKIKNELLEDARHKVSRMNEELENIIKERTKDLLLSREHFKFLADNIPVIVWKTETNGKADYFNKRWYEYTGFSIEESGKRLKEIVHPDDIDSGLRAWQKALESKKPFEYESRFKRASDGQYRWHHSYAIPFKDEEDRIIAWLGTSADVEDQKREMEKKDEFIGVASHELKTPLTSLKGYIQLIEEQKNLPKAVERYISKASESTQKLQNLINDLLDVSRIHAGKLKFSSGSLDLSGLIRSVIETSRHIYPSFTVRGEIDKQIMIKGNAERLEQVLMNLINNAVKYSPDHKEILVRTELENKGVKVSVIDGGIGLSESHQKRIFERFYRVEDQKFQTSGLGMGLYISSEIIREHKGKMTVKSKLHEGSAFSFWLLLNGSGR
jgi:two-component system, OmpR family, phosphate regulon sensor histidine kinase PhoR